MGLARIVSLHYDVGTMSYKFTEQTKKTPRWPTLIKQERRRLKESKAAFGRRFGVTGQAVGYWEDGSNDPPGHVTWWVMQQIEARRRK